MDRKSIIIIAVSVLAMLGWFRLADYLNPPKPMPTNALANATSPARTNQPASPAPGGTPTASELRPSARALVTPNAPEQLLSLENNIARYTFTSHGGGLKQVELKNYPAHVGFGSATVETTNNFAMLNAPAPAPAMVLLGEEAVQGDGVFTLTKTAAGVRAEKTLTNGLRLVKEFQLGTNFVIRSSVRLANTAAQPLTVPAHELVIGTATPLGTNDPAGSLGLFSYDGNSAEHIMDAWFANSGFMCMSSSPRPEYQSQGTNIAWGAVHNQFFTMVVMPGEPVGRLVARPVELELKRMQAGRVVNASGYQAAFVYPALHLEPQQTVERQFQIFAGPKEYKTLARLGNNQDLVMNFGQYFGFFAKALLLSMNGLHHLLNLGYGWTIILITVIIKLVFWPLTQASTRSMKRMSALQPQMNAIREKYKEDPQKMNTKLMEFMRENKVSPVGGCLPMLIQIPFFIGFYTMLQGAIELRGASFLWACDLSQPDTLFMIPGLNLPFNLLPLIMGATQFWQAHMTPPSPGMDPVQQKIMKYMPLMFLFILYNFSAGLALYWTVQNLLSIVQMKLTKNIEDKKSAAAPPAPGPKLNWSAKKKK